jgi:hypothetical protein
MVSLIGLGVCARTAEAAPQQVARESADSVQHVRTQLDKPQTPTLKNAPPPRPLPTFRSSVDGRVWVLTLEEQLHKEFDLTPLQRQSADWSARCCGINLMQVAKGINKAFQQAEERRVRAQIARELAEIEAARAQADER